MIKLSHKYILIYIALFFGINCLGYAQSLDTLDIDFKYGYYYVDHKISRGESLYAIANHYKIPQSSIVFHNKNNPQVDLENGVILPGKILFIPMRKELIKSQKVVWRHKVNKKGDSYFNLCQKVFFCTIKELSKQNNIEEEVAETQPLLKGKILYYHFYPLDEIERHQEERNKPLEETIVVLNENETTTPDVLTDTETPVNNWDAVVSENASDSSEIAVVISETDNDSTILGMFNPIANLEDSIIDNANVVAKIPDFHILKEGETVSFLSAIYGVNYDSLMEWNKNSITDPPLPGQTVYLNKDFAPAIEDNSFKDPDAGVLLTKSINQEAVEDDFTEVFPNNQDRVRLEASILSTTEDSASFIAAYPALTTGEYLKIVNPANKKAAVVRVVDANLQQTAINILISPAAAKALAIEGDLFSLDLIHNNP